MKTRDRTVVMVLGVFVAVAVFWFLLLSPKRADVATLKDDVAAAQSRVDAATTSAATASAAKAKYAADYRAVADLGKAVPVDDDVPSLVFQLQSASKASKIAFDSIKLTAAAAPAAPPAAPPAAQAGAVANAQQGGAAPASPPATPAATAPAATPAPTAPPGGAPPAAGAPAAAGAPPAAGALTTAALPAAQSAFAGLPPGAVVGAAGLPTMPFDFEFSGSFLRLEKLLNRIDAFTRTSGGRIRVNGRLMTIDSIALSGFPEMKATIRATAFLVPAAEGLLAGATPAGPTAVPAAAAAPAGTAPAVPVAVSTPIAGVTR